MTDSLKRDPKKFQRVRELRGSDILFSVAHQHGASKVLLGSSDANVYELDLDGTDSERAPYTGLGHRSYVTGIVSLAKHAVSSGYDGQLVWWDIAARQSIRAIHAHDKWIRRLVATSDGTRLISVGDDMQCRVWDASSGRMIAEFSDHAAMTPHHFPSMLYAVAVSTDGKWIATGDRVGHIAIWDTASWTKTATLETPVMYTWDPTARRHSIGGIRSLAFSPDGSLLAVGGTGKINNIDHLDARARIEIFDWREGKRVQEFEDEKNKGLVEQIVWIPETNWLLAAGGDHKGFFTLYDATKNEVLHQEGIGGHIHGLAWDASRSSLVIAAHERVEIWAWA